MNGVYISPDAVIVNNLVVIFPGVDIDGTEVKNNQDKYNSVAEIVANVAPKSNTAALVIPYPGPSEWGTPINSVHLAWAVQTHLGSVLEELKDTYKLPIDIEEIDVIAHSYGAFPTIAAIEYCVFPTVLAHNEFKLKVHLFEGYAHAATNMIPPNANIRDEEVVARAISKGILSRRVSDTDRELFREPHSKAPPELWKKFELNASARRSVGLAHGTSELKYLVNTAIDQGTPLAQLNLILGLYRAVEEVHATFNEFTMDAVSNQVSTKTIKHENVGHGGGLVDVHEALRGNTPLPHFVVPGYLALTKTLAECVYGNAIAPDAVVDEVYQQLDLDAKAASLPDFARFARTKQPIFPGLTAFKAQSLEASAQQTSAALKIVGVAALGVTAAVIGSFAYENLKKPGM